MCHRLFGFLRRIFALLLCVFFVVSFSSDNKKAFSKTIGTKAIVDLYVVGIPRPSIKYFKKTGGTKGAVLVEINTAGVVTKGAGGARFGIDATKGYLIIDNVQSSDGGDYEVDAKALGVTITENMNLVVGGLLLDMIFNFFI